MDREIKNELVYEINTMKKLIKKLVADGDLTPKEQQTIMKHFGAVKSVLGDTGYESYYAKHRMRFERM
jgi:hypothetical protein